MACNKDAELENSIFISDSENTDLPMYSEWGYNTFGAYFDRVAFVSNNNEIPMKVLAHSNNTQFIFNGQQGNRNYYDNRDKKVIFKINNLMPLNYVDLLVLNDTIFDLANPNCQTIIVEGTDTIRPMILSGRFYIKKAQRLLVDEVQKEVILSGYFDFKYLYQNEPTAVTDGRFDIGVGENNFFSY
jgi:hypothetical protein